MVPRIAGAFHGSLGALEGIFGAIFAKTGRSGTSGRVSDPLYRRQQERKSGWSVGCEIFDQFIRAVLTITRGSASIVKFSWIL